MANPRSSRTNSAQEPHNVYGMAPDIYHAVFVVPDEYAEQALMEVELHVYRKAGEAAVEELREYAKHFVEWSRGGANA